VRLRWWLLRLGATAAALGLWWWLARASAGDLLGALVRISPRAIVVALALSFLALWVGALRWQALLRVYGAATVPPLALLLRAYLEGVFFNTFLPANVGGDVLRAHVTRKAFPGVAGAYLIVAIERVFGLAGLCLLASGMLLMHPIAGLEAGPWLAALGSLVALGAAASPVLVRRASHRLPGRLGELARLAPEVRRPGLLILVLALSLGTQTLVALTGHALVASLEPAVTVADSLVRVPAALATTYFPTIAGLGAREAAFVVLFRGAGVSQADATAASLAFLGVQLVVALAGGVVHLWPGARGTLAASPKGPTS
jgi:uncharacterized membrane protein YbhN (UPF0104 family)